MSTSFKNQATQTTAHQKPEKDFTYFNPRSYLREYHCHWDVEDEFTMTFLHRAYSSMEPQQRCVEIGGGPTIHQLISARNKVDSIVFGEYLARNRHEVKKWKQKTADCFDWTPYFEYVRKLERSDESLLDMQNTLRKKIRAFVPCDVLKPTPIASLPRTTFDVVSAHFCPESITDNEEDFVLGMRHIVSLLKPNGYLHMSFLKESHSYAVGPTDFSAYPLTERKLLRVLKLLECNPLLLEHGPVEPNREYGGTMALFAQRKPVIALNKLKR